MKIVVCFFLLSSLAHAQPQYLWPHADYFDTIAGRYAAPEGYTRVAAEPNSFGEWLRNLPLMPVGSYVHLYDGKARTDQSSYAAVIDLDVGRADLQQCADAVIRLRAEYLFAQGRMDQITFHFTSGHAAAWNSYKKGMRPVVNKSQVTWWLSTRPDSSYNGFRDYLNTVFQYAGTRSLEQELLPVTDPSQVEIGDVFIQGGSPGHAVLVVDVAQNARGERAFMLAQSFMPAQEMHILRTPGFPRSVWYAARAEGELSTPEWTFQHGNLRRFKSK